MEDHLEEESTSADQAAKQASTLQMLQDVLDEILQLVQQEPYLLEYAVPLAEGMLHKLRALQVQRQTDIETVRLQSTLPALVEVEDATSNRTAKRARVAAKRLKPTSRRVKRLRQTTKRVNPS